MKTFRFTVPKNHEYELKKRIRIINKKLYRIHQPNLNIVSISEVSKRETDQYGFEIEIPYVTYEIEYPLQTSLDNSIEYIGTISFKSGIKTVYTEDDSVVLSTIKNEDLHCDHCNVNRYRVVYHVFRRNDKLLQIGSSCAKSYFGFDIERMMEYYRVFHSEVLEISGCGWFYGYSMQSVIAATMMETENGKRVWIGKNKAYEQNKVSTLESVKFWLTLTSQDVENKRRFHLFIADHEDEIKALLDHIVNVYSNMKCDTDFDYNVYNQLFDEKGKFRYLITKPGIVAYIAWKTLFEMNKAEKQPDKLASTYQGSIKDQLEIQITIRKLMRIENQFGISDLLIMEDKKGNVYKSFYSGYKIKFEEGNEYHLKGTVKKHEEYKGEKQTILNRLVEV